MPRREGGRGSNDMLDTVPDGWSCGDAAACVERRRIQLLLYNHREAFHSLNLPSAAHEKEEEAEERDMREGSAEASAQAQAPPPVYPHTRVSKRERWIFMSRFQFNDAVKFVSCWPHPQRPPFEVVMLPVGGTP
ncbi:hypothetical protein OUZ56_031799 [Daphnia magna]|uniref:Uncharacterized protein n=1 Tax=Daphnia magna TaxID=35525 RepID=A0ABQ9ZV86_9CRUS|nr:hypothetical protein OUZ56_031799 [Daphnia magna]